MDCITDTGGVMVSMLASSAVDRGFETIKLVFVTSLLSMQHSGEIADWLARNQDNVSEWDDMSICGLLFQ